MLHNPVLATFTDIEWLIEEANIDPAIGKLALLTLIKKGVTVEMRLG
jgi:hypothetical protein